MGRSKKPKDPNLPDDGTVRASISFPTALYKALEEEARQRKVSLAWIVRDATERYMHGEVAADGKGSKR
jgi:hypothetical protein